MVDPRIYRAGLALVAVGVIVFAFSLTGQPGAASTSLAAPASTAASAFSTMTRLAKDFPNRRPGSAGDRRLAAYVAARLQAAGGTRAAGGFSVSTTDFSAATASGERTLETVTATRPGLTPGAIVVVSHRDAMSSPDTADLSGTAALLGLAHSLGGQTENHSIMLVSTSGSVGAAGAAQLAASLARQPVDAVIVLGDLVAAQPSKPIIVPWSDSQVVAPPVLRETLAHYVAAQSGLSTAGNGIIGQFAHIAFPLTVTEQAPFGGDGIPAVLLSLSGYGLPATHEALSGAHLAEMEEGVIQAVGALDNAAAVPAPSSYLLISGQMVPAWAVRLLVMTLILPALLATVDGLARVRRRGHSVLRWIGWVLAGAVPFLLALLLLLLVRVTGLLPATPPGLVAGGVRLGASGIALMALLVALIAGSFVFVRPLCIRLAAGLGRAGRTAATPAADGASVAVMVVMCVIALVLWTVNPFAAALLVPALHVWLWLASPAVRSRRWLMVGLALFGVLPGILLVAYCAYALGLGPVGLAWSGVLAVAGGHLGASAGLVWCLLLGCSVSALVIAARTAPRTPDTDKPVTVRGPVTYAGPGSLGGTQSALGSRR